MRTKGLWWKVPAALLGTATALVLVLLAAAGCALYVHSVRQAVLERAVAEANARTDYDIDLGNLYLSPLEHSPIRLYRAYKGQADLPLQIEVDSLFLGHRGKDTLLYTRALRLRATLLTSQGTDSLLNIPIVVDKLSLEQTTFHSDTLIPAVGVDAIVQRLQAVSPGLVLAKGQFPLDTLLLHDAYVGITLRGSKPDTAARDSTPLLMAYDVHRAEMRRVQFVLQPLGMDIRVRSLDADVLADVGAALYDARQLNIGNASFNLGKLSLPFDTLYGNTRVDLAAHRITSKGLHARSAALGAQADLKTTEMDLQTMRVDVAGDALYKGSKAGLRGYYDIDDERYNLSANVQRVDLTELLNDSTHVILAGDIHAEGRGIDPNSRKMRTKVNMHLTDAVYGDIDASGLRLDASLANRTVDGTLHLPIALNNDLQLRAQTEHQFRVEEFMRPKQMNVDYHTQMQDVHARVANEDLYASRLTADFATDSTTSLNLATDGLSLDLSSPMHVMRLADQAQRLLKVAGDTAVLRTLTTLTDLTMLDTLRRLVPDMQTHIQLSSGSPVQPFIDRTGLDIHQVDLTLASDSAHTDLSLDASIPEISHPDDSTALRLPAARAAMRVQMAEGTTDASLTADSRLTDGVMSLHDLHTDAALRFDLQRTGRTLNGNGQLTMDSLRFAGMDLGNRKADIRVSPSEQYANALKADVQLDDMPLDILDSILHNADLDLRGAVRAAATVDGLPAQTDISAEVLPLGVSAEYKPYEVTLSLGEKPIVMEHNRVLLNKMPIYGADSTYLSLDGNFDLKTMNIDVEVKADSFAPVKLVKDGPIPVYGDLATDLNGRVTGRPDSVVADVDVTILPTTDITYPIDQKNLAQVKPHGTVNVKYGTKQGTMDLDGVVHVDSGVIRYSPKLYPVMPFRVDSGGTVTLNGPLRRARLNLAASQRVKADVQSEGEETRRVDFTTGVRVNGVLDSLGLNAVGFYLEAPKDEVITRELRSLDEDTREGLAATLLATGMYVGESNEAAQREGYALSSIVNSRINAAMANSKLGKAFELDISSGQTNHASGKSNDMNISISKTMLNDKLRITLGSSISDNPEVNNSGGLLRSITADYKLTKSGNVLLRVFSQRDYNNILEGELVKSGIGVHATQDWHRRQWLASKADSINRTYSLAADAAVAYRSNNSLGPNLMLTSNIRNLFGRDEVFTIKADGAYYWALRDRHPGDPKKTDTYKLGVHTSLVFPYLHWVGTDTPEGDTRYSLGYQYENIAGGYGVHKMTAGLTYFFHSSPYITHAFTPFSLSVVRVKAESEDLLDKAAEYPQLIKVLAGNELVPSVGYTFTYNDYRATRPVNTMLELGFKEAGNLINAIYCATGRKWNEQDKPIGKLTFNQFVKLTAELRNRFNLPAQISIATRLYAGANIPLGNSGYAPLSEAFYAGGPNSLRAAAPYAYGPGNFYSAKYNQNFFHAGDVKLEANFELRFPIVWKLYGAAFVDAGNVWNWYSTVDLFKAAGYEDYLTRLEIPEDLKDGLFGNDEWAKQIALGTGAGLRLDIDGLVVRLDLGVAIHSPYQTFKYNKDGTPDTSKPIKTYYNIPSVFDALRLNFGIGYPF